MFICRFCIFTPSRHLHSLSGVLGSLRQGRRIRGSGRREAGGGRGGSPNAALFCHREGELTAVSLPERLVLKVAFHSALRRQRGRRGTSCWTDRGTSGDEHSWTDLPTERKTLLSNNNQGPVTQRPSSRATAFNSVQLPQILRIWENVFGRQPQVPKNR